MKRVTKIGLSGMFLASLLVTLAAAQSDSLGDYARSIHKDKTTTAKTYDNDNLPTNDKLSVVGQQPQADTNSGQTGNGPATGPNWQADASAPSSDPSKAANKGGAPSSDDQAKLNDQWKGKISGQKDQIDLLARELDVKQREYQLRAAAMYADAGNRLRNAGEWDKEDADYKQQIADKQKALDDAKQKLDLMQEDARKQGVPSSAREPE